MNGFKVVLKAEDSPARPDPQGAMIAHRALLRTIHEETWRLVNLLARDDAQTLEVRQMIKDRATDLGERTARALETVETMAMGYRAAGKFSAVYGTDDIGVR